MNHDPRKNSLHSIRRHGREVSPVRLDTRQQSRTRFLRPVRRWYVWLGLPLLGLALLCVRWCPSYKIGNLLDDHQDLRIISYAYRESSPHELRNLEFFLRHGVYADPKSLFFIIVNGGTCTPCESADAKRPNVHVLRRENYGYDFGAHGHLLNQLEIQGQLHRLKRLYCINASVRGPFLPKFFRDRPWTAAFDSLMRGNVAAVGASLVCLPKQDAGGPGARLEGFAFALSAEGMLAARRAGVFRSYPSKKDAILYGEFGLTRALFQAGLSVDTLMTKYQRIWNASNELVTCNRNVFPSRHGAVDGVDLHPYETLFMKTQWMMSYPYVLLYSEWMDHPDAPELPDIHRYYHFQHDGQVHPIEPPRVASPLIGDKKLVLVIWDTPNSSVEWENIEHLLASIRLSDSIDYLLVIRDGQVAARVREKRVDRLPNVRIVSEIRSSLNSLCMQGLTILRTNSRYLAYNFFVFITQHARGPVGVWSSNDQWIVSLEEHLRTKQVGLLFSFIHLSGEMLQPDPSFFCMDHRGLHLLLRGSVCDRTDVTGTLLGMKRVASDVLGRSIGFSSLQPGTPVLQNTASLMEPNLRQIFSRPLTELSSEELSDLIFVPVATINKQDSNSERIIAERLRELPGPFSTKLSTQVATNTTSMIS